jgi:hypothetical protein
MRKPIGLTAPYREDDDDIQDYKKPWVGLTAEEVERCKFNALNGTAWSVDVDINLLVHEIEAKLKEKNT